MPYALQTHGVADNALLRAGHSAEGVQPEPAQAAQQAGLRLKHALEPVQRRQHCAVRALPRRLVRGLRSFGALSGRVPHSRRPHHADVTRALWV